MTHYQTIESHQYLGQSDLTQLIVNRTSPLVIKGLCKSWPLVEHSTNPKRTLQALQATAASQYVFVNQADSSSLGRFFYNEDLTDKNFSQSPQLLPTFLESLSKHLEKDTENKSQSDTTNISDNIKADQSPDVYQYMASTSVDYCFPTLLKTHSLPIDLPQPLISAWLGTQSVAASHFDVPNNIACNVFGKRRFTLFPPDQIDNLYIGPIDLTPAGQPVSLVNVNQPDFAQFPKFEQAIKHGFQVTLEPGDALFIPSMWWHNVEALEAINLLFNYWWQSTPAFAGAPMDALKHALLSIAHRPAAEKQAWQTLFNHYVFNENNVAEHIPKHSRGTLGDLTEDEARKIRAALLAGLNK